VDDSDDDNSEYGGQDVDNNNDDEILQEALKLVKELKAQDQMPLKRRAIEDDDCDDDTPATKKSRQSGPTVSTISSSTLKSISNTYQIQFSVSSSSAVRSKLPQRRKEKHTVPSGTIPSSLSPHASSSPPSTPTRQAPSSNKARLVDQTPVTKTVTKRACTLVRIFLATVNAFLDDAALEAQLKACYKDSKKHLFDAGVLEAHDKTKTLSSSGRKIVSCSLTIILHC
jgi:hypothetical protein